MRCLVLDDPRSVCLGNEPVRVAGQVVGRVTSGGYAHYVQKSMAQGYVPAALAENEAAGLFEIEILGHRRPARVNVEPPFDPSGEKMRT